MKSLSCSNFNRIRNLPGHANCWDSLNGLFFGLLRGQTCCIGDGDSCNANDEFDNMNSVKIFTDVMFKSRTINPAVASFYHDTYKSNGLL